MMCESGRRPVNGGARNQDVDGSVTSINSPLPKQILASSGCCLQSQSRAQVAQARDTRLLLFISKSRSGAARAVSSPGVLSRRKGAVLKSEMGCRFLVRAIFLERRYRLGIMDVMRRVSARYLTPSRVDVGSSGVKRERAIGPRETRARGSAGRKVHSHWSLSLRRSLPNCHS